VGMAWSGAHVSLAEAEAAYTEARGWAMGTSTRRLRWRYRRLRQHISDQVELAQAKAVRDELRARGEALT